MDLGSIGTSVNNLMQNRLFQQYLSGAGSALAQGNPVAQMVNQMSQQNIAAQSQNALNQKYMEMVSGMLTGKSMPAGAKLTRDEKGTKIELPPEGDKEMASPKAFNTEAGSIGNINPFLSSQPSISAADLAGLGPQDVSRALSNATSVEALRQQAIARRAKASARQPLEEAFPIPHPETGTMSLRQWNALPVEEKEFAAYVQTAKRLGAPKDELTRRFFKSLDPTEREKFIRATMKDPKLMAAAKELSRAAATKISIGEKIAGKVAEKKALGKLEPQLWFSKSGWIDAVDKHINNEEMQRKIFMEAQKEGGGPGLIKTKEAKEIIKYIEGKISVGGTIQDVRLSDDGRTMIWTVKWRSGDTEDISYVIRP